MSRGAALAAVLAVSAGLLAGCVATGDAAPTSTPTASSAPSASPTPSVTPTPTAAELDPADPSTWVIDADGIGPLRLGDARDDALAAAPQFVPVSGPACADPDVEFLGEPGATRQDARITLEFEGDELVAIRLAGVDGPETTTGIGRGSTVAELKGAYALVRTTEVAAGYPQYTVEGDPGWITFQPSTDETGAPTMELDQVWVVRDGLPRSEYCA